EVIGARELVEVGADAGAQLGAPVAVVRAHGGAHRGEQVLDALVVGVEEARLLGREQLVEGRAADAGGAHDVGDRRPGVALLGNDGLHRSEQARSLRGGDVYGGHPVYLIGTRGSALRLGAGAAPAAGRLAAVGGGRRPARRRAPPGRARARGPAL